MTVLKPKSDAGVAPAPVSTPTAPGVAGLGRAVDEAKAAKATQEASDAKVQAATGEDATAESAAPAVAPVAEDVLARIPRDLRAQVADHHVLVLGVVNPGAPPFRPEPADDRALREELR